MGGQPMRDIREDLEESVSKLKSEKEGLQARIKLLEGKIARFEDLLIQEELFWETETQQDLLFPHTRSKQKEHSRLGEFLLSILKDGNPHPLEELLSLARNQDVVANSKYPRRALNFVLVGMERHNKVERIDGAWRISNKGKGNEKSNIASHF